MKKSKFITICAAICIFSGLAASVVFIPGARNLSSQWREKALDTFGIHTHDDLGVTYWCPMHPDVKREKAGVCPICNMALIELEKETGEREEGILLLTDRQIQQAGVRTDHVKYRDLVREVDASGRIAYDERRLAHITSWISGRSRVEKLYVNFTGQAVKKGEILMELYSPSLITSIEEYRLSIETLRKIEETGSQQDILNANGLLASTRNRLFQWGLKEDQINKFENKNSSLQEIVNIPIYSPISGTVIEKLIQEGQYVDEGSMLLHIADLSKVWLLADIYEYELPFIKLGQEVIITTRAFPGKIFKGEVAFIEPFLREETRTIRIRCDIDNENQELKPGMYARAQIKFEFPGILSVPESAALHSGRREIVFVEEGDGRYRPVEVSLGRKWLYSGNSTSFPDRGLGFGSDSERYHEVLNGLRPDDVVVVGGNFLLNAESQFQGVLKKMIPANFSLKEKTAQVLPKQIQKEMENIIDTYLALQGALANDALEDAGKQVGRLKETIQDVMELQFIDTEVKENGSLYKYFEELKTSLDSFKPNSDIVAARIAFGDLSRHIIHYLKDYSDSERSTGELYIFLCPMAPGYGKWVQKEHEINNPYMGRAMLRCGSPAEFD